MSTDWVELIHIWIQVCFYQHILNSDQLTPVWSGDKKEKDFSKFTSRHLPGPPKPRRGSSGVPNPSSLRFRLGVISGRPPPRGTGTFCTTRRSTCCNRIRRPLSHRVWPCSFSFGPPLFLRRFRYTGDQRRRATPGLVIKARRILRVAVVLAALLRSSFEKRRSFDPFVPRGPTQLCPL